MPEKLNSKVIIAVGIVILIFILVVIFIVKGALTKGGTSKARPTPGAGVLPSVASAQKSIEKADPKAIPSIYQQSKEYLDEQQKMDLTIAPENEKSKKIGALLTKVPYQGKYFYFDYSTDDLGFKVILDKDRVLEANQEFNTFLKQNGVESQSWFLDLKIEYK
jgi:hypothetical protein